MNLPSPGQIRRRTTPHLDSNTVLDDGLSSVRGDLVVGLVAVLESKVVVLDVDIEEGDDQLVLDLVPAAQKDNA